MLTKRQIEILVFINRGDCCFRDIDHGGIVIIKSTKNNDFIRTNQKTWKALLHGGFIKTDTLVFFGISQKGKKYLRENS